VHELRRVERERQRRSCRANRRISHDSSDLNGTLDAPQPKGARSSGEGARERRDDELSRMIGHGANSLISAMLECRDDRVTAELPDLHQSNNV